MEAQKSISYLRQPSIGINNEQARSERLRFLNSLGHSTETYTDSQLEANKVKSNIESFIGTMSIPVGLVGPLNYKNKANETEQVFTAAATTEGALIASMNRGVSTMNLSGGFSAFVKKQRMLRAPMFCFDSTASARKFEVWLQDKIAVMQDYIIQFSKNAKLVEIKCDYMGRNLLTQFYYETGDASGQNMTTICTWQLCLWIEREYKKLNPTELKNFTLDVNGSADKKISHDSIVNGRGIHVVAECVIDEDVLRKKLKVTSSEMLEWYGRSSYVVNHHGMIGNNVNIANPIAAIFAATGQDLACVHESAVGYLYFEKHERGLYACVKLPRLVIATVGGGTSLPSQRENLELMGCLGSGKVERFAELIAGFCLGLELSTFSAMVNGQFAIAHERLGRNKPVNFLTKNESIEQLLKENILNNKNIHVKALDDLEDHNGIVTALTSQNSEKFLGLSLWELVGQEETYLSLLKSKPTDKEFLKCMYVLTGLLDPKLARAFDHYQDKSDFKNGHKKELHIYEKLNTELIPHIWGTYQDDEREIYLILMEYLSKSDYKIINSELDSDKWCGQSIKTMIKGSVKLQSQLKNIGDDELFTRTSKEEFLPFAQSSFQVLKDEYGRKYMRFLDLYERALIYLDECDESELNFTLVHNDFNPRNVAINHQGGLKVYDFELAALDVAQRDVIEFLSFVIDSSNIDMSFESILEEYKGLHFESIGCEVDEITWQKEIKFAFAKYIVTRLNLYALGNKLTRYPFLDKVIQNTVDMNKVIKL